MGGEGGHEVRSGVRGFAGMATVALIVAGCSMAGTDKSGSNVLLLHLATIVGRSRAVPPSREPPHVSALSRRCPGTTSRSMSRRRTAATRRRASRSSWTPSQAER